MRNLPAIALLKNFRPLKNSKHKPAPTGVRAIITDIEGTTSSLSFVKDVLFPYARTHLAEFVARRAPDPQVKSILDAVNEHVGRPLTADQTISQLIAWMDEDKKITPLKNLQGLIWEDGYRRGDFTGHIYEDAVSALRDWNQQGIALYVYSSGSIYAQKLLFGNTAFGDLTHLFKGYYDTTTGHKRESASYKRIIEDLNVPAAFILFLSDIQEELDAARGAGMKTIWLVRGEDLKDSATAASHSSGSDATHPNVATHPIVRSFSEINLEKI